MSRAKIDVVTFERIMTLDLKCKRCETTFKFKSKWKDNPYSETINAWNRRVKDG